MRRPRPSMMMMICAPAAIPLDQCSRGRPTQQSISSAFSQSKSFHNYPNLASCKIEFQQKALHNFGSRGNIPLFEELLCTSSFSSPTAVSCLTATSAPPGSEKRRLRNMQASCSSQCNASARWSLGGIYLRGRYGV